MEEKQININIAPEIAQGTYANMAVIAHSSSEFVIDFVQVMPGMKQAAVRSRIVIAPEHAKRLMFALQDNVGKYEQQFGKITLSGQPTAGSTVPMSFGGGEA